MVASFSGISTNCLVATRRVGHVASPPEKEFPIASDVASAARCADKSPTTRSKYRWDDVVAREIQVACCP